MFEITFSFQSPDGQKEKIKHILFEQLKGTFPQKISGYLCAVKINDEINCIVIRTSIHHNTSLRSCTVGRHKNIAYQPWTYRESKNEA
jgi:hypothetical protein